MAGEAFFFFPPFTISLHTIPAVVLIYVAKCSPFNMLSNSGFYLAIHAFVYEVQVEMYLIWQLE